MKKLSIPPGTRFGNYTVVSDAPTQKMRTMIVCVCDCGTEKTVGLRHLMTGRIISCGCYAAGVNSKRMRTHGLSKTNEYRIWKNIKNRCENPKTRLFKWYGERGIGICERWQKFENFYADMGIRPSLNHSVERIDNEMGYSPENCKWATRLEQAANKRNSRWITFNGERLILAEWARRLGIHESVLSYRLGAMSIERALTMKVRHLVK